MIKEIAEFLRYVIDPRKVNDIDSGNADCCTSDADRLPRTAGIRPDQV